MGVSDQANSLKSLILRTDEAAGAGATDHIEVVAGLRRGVGVCVSVDGGYEAAEDHEGGQAADTAAIEFID